MNRNYLIGFVFIVVGVISITFGSFLGTIPIAFGILLQLKGRGIIGSVFYQTPSVLSRECKVLRLSIIIYWVLLVLALLVNAFEEAGLPLETTKFMDNQTELIPNWVLGGVLGFVTVYFIGNVGVFFLKPWGRSAYVTGLLGILALTPFIGTMVVTPIYSTLETILSILNGVALCLLYLSPAREHFKHTFGEPTNDE